MSGNTSETRCKWCDRPIKSGEYCKRHEKHEPTPPEGEADPLSPLLDMRVVEGLSEELRKVRAEGEAVPEQATRKPRLCLNCGKSWMEHFADALSGDGASEAFCDKDSHARRWKAEPAPVVSTAAPEPPLRISFDIGGVLSKYPEVFRPMVDALQKGGAEVFVITDMHEHDKSVCFVRGNGYDIPSERILNSDYAAHGEACKAETIRQHGIKIHLDDFAGYCAHTECVSLFVWPNPLKPYYADDFKTDGTEGDFGRRKAAKI